MRIAVLVGIDEYPSKLKVKEKTLKLQRRRSRKERRFDSPQGSTPPPKKINVIFKVCNLCNGACTFCSIGPSGRDKISWPDFEVLVSRLERLAVHRGLEKITLTFHGGEPTIMGASWYEKACRLVSALPLRVQFNMQSNLISFTPAMVDVALRFGIKVGSSIDPLFGARRNKQGEDGFPAWLETYKRLNEQGLRVHPIFVVTAEALNRPEELYRIAESLGGVASHRFVLQLNPVYPQGKASERDNLLIDPEKLGDYYVKLMKLWIEKGRSVRLLPLENFFRRFSGEKYLSFPCTFGGECTWSHVGVDFDLRVAGCGRRLDSEKYLGSLRENEFVDILEGCRENRRIARRSMVLKEGACLGCEYFALCHGGCPDDAELTAGDLMEKHSLCEGYKVFFSEMRKSAKSKAQFPPPLKRKALEKSSKLVVLGTDPGFLNNWHHNVEKGREGRKHEKWLLPTKDDGALSFDSSLESLLTRDTNMLRVWVQNHKVGSLAVWEELMVRPRVRVVLFQSAGLEAAALKLNHLGATIILYLPVLVNGSGWEEEVKAVFERFLSDPGWKSQVYPFTWMMANTVHNHAVPITNAWGFYPAPGKMVKDPSLTFSVYPPELLDEMATLQEQLSQGGGPWLRRHKECLNCPLFKICGGHLAPVHGPCAKELYAFAERIYVEGLRLRREVGL